MSINQAYIPLKALLGSAQHAVVETCRSFPCQSNLSAGGSGVVSAAHVVQSAREPVLHSEDPAGATDRPAHFRLVSGEDQPLCCTTPWRRMCLEEKHTAVLSSTHLLKPGLCDRCGKAA